jgi:uncharacterized membrane protein YuzA (DUF378 family)
MHDRQLSPPDLTALALVVVGALNWGLVAIARFDLVAFIFGGMDFGETNVGSRIVYGLVGIAGVYTAVRLLPAIRTGTHRAAYRS